MTPVPQSSPSGMQTAAEPWRAAVSWLSGLALLAGGAWLVCPGGQCHVPELDRAGLALSHAWRSEALDPWMQAATWLGSVALLLPLAALASWRLPRIGQRREAGFVLTALIGAMALAHLVKVWVARPRPDLFSVLGAMPADWSYPSAHAMQAAAVGLALFLVLAPKNTAWRIPLAALLTGVVLLVSVSRVYLQVHFPTDVLVGMGAAVLWVAGLHALVFGRSQEWDTR